MLYLIKSYVKNYKLIISTQTKVIKYLKYQMPKKNWRKKIEDFCFLSEFFKTQLLHYFKQHQLKDNSDRFSLLNSCNESGVYG